MRHRIVIEGHCPTKKNGKTARGRAVVIDPEIKAQVLSLTWQAREKWSGWQPIERVKRIVTRWRVRDGRADLDGKYTTIQDVLVQAGVLRNDSIARIPAFSCEAEIVGHDKPETVEVEIEV